MQSLAERIQRLEQDVLSPEMRLSGYHDLPFAIFRYDPEEEFAARSEIRLLRSRLHSEGKQVIEVSLAAQMWSVVAEAESLELLFGAEQTAGLQRTVETVNAILDADDALVARIVEALRPHDPEATVGLLVRGEAFFPFFRTSAILSRLHGKVRVPTVLFYPGTLEGTVGLRFMGVYQADPNYRPNIY